eukprot:scaffold51969_cov61-Phaeocystis_antarctica.AAC.2
MREPPTPGVTGEAEYFQVLQLLAALGQSSQAHVAAVAGDDHQTDIAHLRMLACDIELAQLRAARRQVPERLIQHWETKIHLR